MSTMKELLRADLHKAMKARDELVSSTLRLALTAVTNEEVVGQDAGLSAADRERAEGAVLDAYLPAALTDDELRALVAAAIAETGAAGPAAMGQVMKAVTPKVAGRAEGGRVAAEVKAQLAAG
jgi:uncharacterized protein